MDDMDEREAKQFFDDEEDIAPEDRDYNQAAPDSGEDEDETDDTT